MNGPGIQLRPQPLMRLHMSRTPKVKPAVGSPVNTAWQKERRRDKKPEIFAFDYGQRREIE